MSGYVFTVRLAGPVAIHTIAAGCVNKFAVGGQGAGQFSLVVGEPLAFWLFNAGSQAFLLILRLEH